VAPGTACTEHPLISVTYLGIEAERIVKRQNFRCYENEGAYFRYLSVCIYIYFQVFLVKR
jgi:hypothetical protein